MGAAAVQIKSLIKSFSEGDDARFYSTAMHIAAEHRNMINTTFSPEGSYYNDGQSIKSVAVAKDVSALTEIADARKYDSSSRTRQ